MEKLKAVIFDVDGTMLNTEFLWQEAWKDTGNEFNVPSFGNTFHRTVGLTGQAVNKIIDEELGDYPYKEEILSAARKRGMRYLDERIEIMPGCTELLEKLEALNIDVAVATTTSRDKTEERLKKLGLYDKFKIILCGNEVTNRKPDPEIYLTVLSKLDIPKENVLVLEDTGYGVTSAYRAGLKVIMVPSINQPTSEEKKIAYNVVSSLYDVIRILEENNYEIDV